MKFNDLKYQMFMLLLKLWQNTRAVVKDVTRTGLDWLPAPILSSNNADYLLLFSQTLFPPFADYNIIADTKDRIFFSSAMNLC